MSETPYKPHGETGAPRPPTRPPPVGPRQAPVATRSHPRAGPCPPSRHRHIRCASIKPPRVPGRARTAPPHPRKKIASPCGVAAAQSPPRRPGRRLSRSDGPPTRPLHTAQVRTDVHTHTQARARAAFAHPCSFGHARNRMTAQLSSISWRLFLPPAPADPSCGHLLQVVRISAMVLAKAKREESDGTVGHFLLHWL